MPDIFGMLICNPLLERTLLENKEAKGDHRDLKLLDENTEIKESLHQLIIKVQKTKTEINVDFIFNNFRLLLNEKTIEKIFEFIFKIGHSLDSQDNQFDKIRKEILKYQKEKGKDDVIDELEFASPRDESGLFETLSKIRQDYLVKEKKIKVIKLEKLEEKQRMNLSGTINNIEVWIPLDWTIGDAKLMSISFSANLTHYSYTHKNYYINNLTSLIFKVDNITNVDDSNISLKGVKVKIEHVLEKDSEINPSALAKSISNEFIRSTLLK